MIKKKTWIIGMTILIFFCIVLFELMIKKDYGRAYILREPEEQQEANIYVKSNNISDETQMIMGQNFIWIEDTFVGSLIYDSYSSNYYMGIQADDGEIHQTKAETECSNLVLYEDMLYFINDSFPDSMQNIWHKGSEKGRIIRIDKDVENTNIFEENILTKMDELTNRFYIWKDRIYYQVVEVDEKKENGEGSIHFYIYSRTLDGKNKEEIWNGFNWTTDFAMESGNIYIPDEGDIIRYNIDSKEITSLLSTHITQELHNRQYKILEIVANKDNLLFILDIEGEKQIYGIKWEKNNDTVNQSSSCLEDLWVVNGERSKGFLYRMYTFLLADGSFADIRSNNFDIRSSSKKPDGAEILQRIGEYLYIYRNKRIYKVSLKDRDIEKENQEEVGIKVRSEKEWRIETDYFGGAIGYNFFQGNEGVEGNGYIYTRDMGLYEGEQGRVGEEYNLYWKKDGQWELFVTHPVEDEEHIIYENSVEKVYEKFIQNITYYDKYIYYVLVKDTRPKEGGGTEGYIYRVPDQGGAYELLIKGSMFYFIYNHKIYYRTIEVGENKGLYYWEMSLDGSEKRLIYKGDFRYPAEREVEFTVGGGCIYVREGNGILGVNLESGLQKYLEMIEVPKRFYYEDGYLYVQFQIYPDNHEKIIRIDVKTEKEELVTADIITNSLYMYRGYLYYTLWERKETGFKFTFRIINLSTMEVRTYDLAEMGPNTVPFAYIEVSGEDIIVRIRIWDKENSSNAIYNNTYFKQKVENIWDKGFESRW